MTPQDRRLTPDPPSIEITQDEILADLAWPGPPPSLWLVPPACLGHSEHIDTQLERMDEAA